MATASACSSQTFLQKSSASASTCPHRRKSFDTTCSSNSSCFLQKKKPANPLANSIRSNSHNSVRQRVMSAKLVKVRNLQSQLNDANYHLMELAKENRALKTLQRRQDKALNNYEGVNADLPRLIKSHEAENRMLVERNRSLRKTVKELADQIKLKDEELTAIRDQLKHLTALSRDKHLGEREKLKDQLDDSKDRLKKYEGEIDVLKRKHVLDTKNLKQKLNVEIMKNRELKKELSQALMEVDRLSLEGKGQKSSKKRFGTSPRNRQSMSMVSLSQESIDSKEEEDTETVSSDVKLEPICTRKEVSFSPLMESPVEKIKARLSSASTTNQLTEVLEKLNLEEENLRKSVMVLKSSRPHSTKLETLRKSEDFEESRANITETMTNLSQNLDRQTELYEATRLQTERIMDELKEVDTVEEKLKAENSQLLLKDEDFEIVNRIWEDEFAFKKTEKKEPTVAIEDKKKLLAALRDIDNGKSVESGSDEGETKKNRLIKDLFG